MYGLAKMPYVTTNVMYNAFCRSVLLSFDSAGPTVEGSQKPSSVTAPSVLISHSRSFRPRSQGYPKAWQRTIIVIDTLSQVRLTHDRSYYHSVKSTQPICHVAEGDLGYEVRSFIGLTSSYLLFLLRWLHSTGQYSLRRLRSYILEFLRMRKRSKLDLESQLVLYLSVWAMG